MPEEYPWLRPSNPPIPPASSNDPETSLPRVYDTVGVLLAFRSWITRIPSLWLIECSVSTRAARPTCLGREPLPRVPDIPLRQTAQALPDQV